MGQERGASTVVSTTASPVFFLRNASRPTAHRPEVGNRLDPTICQEYYPEPRHRQRTYLETR